METTPEMKLRDKEIFPDDIVLKKALGKSFKIYSRLLKLFADNEMTHEWRYYRDGNAWLCKVQRKKRTIVWMSAWTEFIKATIYFPEKYLEKVYDLKINRELKEKFCTSKNIGKSKACVFEIDQENILDEFEQVMLLKTVCK
ncbi:MAG: DUF3788 family protein [Chitinispirillaceae bacterium]|nr:DUF3788 family protein [Chitinispirillaceae bacterium]